MRWLEPMRRAGLVALGVGTLILAACASPSQRPAAAPPPPAPAPAPAPKPPPAPPALLAEDVQRLREMPGPDLADESQRLLQSVDPRARLKAAIALAQPQHPARDESRAVALAEEVARSPDVAPALRDTATAVALWLDEQRRAEVNGRRAQTRAREDEAKMAVTEARLKDMERRAQEAEKKLEALRAIERELSGRAAGARQ